MTLPASLFLDERPLAQAIAPPPEPPGDEPQSLVLAVELGQVAQQLRHRWARLDLNLPERGTWPLESWRPALHEALYGLLGGAAQARPWQRITLNPALDARHGRLRLDILGQAEEGRRWLPAAVEAARRLAGWQGGRLLWHAQARIGAYACCCRSARPGADEGRRVEFRRRAQLAHRRTQVDEADDPLLLAEPQAGVHHRIGGHLAGPPHRPQSLGIGAQHQAVGGAAGSQQLLSVRHLRVVLQASDRHDQQRCAQRHVAGLGQRFLGGVRLAARQGAGVEVAQGPAAFALYQDEAPGPQLPVVRGTQGDPEQPVELLRRGAGSLRRAWETRVSKASRASMGELLSETKSPL